jgi:catechol 2,3-dioxygenase-like lactoylglutathione lyase family enzyme
MTVSTPLGQLSEFMVPVTNLDDAVGFWTSVMGFTLETQSSGFAAVVDPQSGQRIGLVQDEIGPQFALSFKVPDVDAAVERLLASGSELKYRERGAPGFEYAMVCARDEFPMMLWSQED